MFMVECVLNIVVKIGMWCEVCSTDDYIKHWLIETTTVEEFYYNAE